MRRFLTGLAIALLLPIVVTVALLYLATDSKALVERS